MKQKLDPANRFAKEASSESGKASRSGGLQTAVGKAGGLESAPPWLRHADSRLHEGIESRASVSAKRSDPRRDQQMKIHVQFFSRLRELAGVSEMEIEVATGSTSAICSSCCIPGRPRYATGTRAFSSPPESSLSVAITSSSRAIGFRSCRRCKAGNGALPTLSSRAALDGEGPRMRSLASA